MTADWQVFPTTGWNYALDIDTSAATKSIEVIEGKVSGSSVYQAACSSQNEREGAQGDGVARRGRCGESAAAKPSGEH